MEAIIKTLATKDDIAKQFSDVYKEFAGVREEISRSNVDLSTKIAESKTDNIKWMFLFWIGQVGTTIGFIMLYLKK